MSIISNDICYENLVASSHYGENCFNENLEGYGKKISILIKCQVQALVLDGVIAQQQPQAKYKWGQAFAQHHCIFKKKSWVFLCFIAFLFHLTTSLLPFVDSLLFCSIYYLCYFVFGYFSFCYSMLYFFFFLAPLLLYSLFLALLLWFSQLFCLVVPFFIASCFIVP